MIGPNSTARTEVVGNAIGYASWDEAAADDTESMGWKVTVGEDGEWIARAET